MEASGDEKELSPGGKTRKRNSPNGTMHIRALWLRCQIKNHKGANDPALLGLRRLYYSYPIRRPRREDTLSTSNFMNLFAFAI
jgi:hypothetical protein